MARYSSDCGVSDARNAVLADNWWTVALRGVLSICFGITALAAPVATMLALVLVFGAYSFVDGCFTIVLALRGAGTGERWGLLLLNGLFGILAGIAAAVWPGMTVLVFVMLIASWAVVSGGLMLGAAFRLKISHGRWLLACGAIISLICGLLLFVSPLMGVVVLTWWVGIYALVFGAILIALALTLRSHRADQTSHPTPASA